jgi:hypothetical protein
MTDCSQQKFEFQGEKSQRVTAEFSGERLTSDGGLLLLRQLEAKDGIIDRFISDCFIDNRQSGQVTHSLQSIVRQRVFALCAGYEDINDHHSLGHDTMFALCGGRETLAGRSTINRIESAGRGGGRIYLDAEKARTFFMGEYLRTQRRPPQHVVIDIDSNAVPLHGEQERRHYSAHYDEYCYLPLLMFIDDHLVYTRLRDAGHDGASGVVPGLKTVVGKLRGKFPKTKIMVRADSGFCRDEILSWCEDNGVDYVIGLARNSRLNEILEPFMLCSQQENMVTGKAARCFADFRYQTRDSWKRERRVIGKAEYLNDGANPRYVVTSLTTHEAQHLYERIYCARGDMENRIKEQLQLFSDRLSCHTYRGNMIRHYLSALAYVVMSAFRRKALRGTELARAYFDTIRLRLFKIGAQFKYSCRRIVVRLAAAFPLPDVFSRAARALGAT